jgi:hypothetical protein
MKKEKEIRDVTMLERELTTQNVRYQLALKDGAVDSIVAETIRAIASLEEKIQEMREYKGREALPIRSYSSISA